MFLLCFWYIFLQYLQYTFNFPCVAGVQINDNIPYYTHLGEKKKKREKERKSHISMIQYKVYVSLSE